jgi:hypothetical protein
MWDIWFHSQSNITVFRAEQVNSSIGLCEYMRMLLLWGPIMVGFYLAFIALVLYVFLIMPIMSGGIGFISIALTAVCVIAFFLFVIGAFFIIFLCDTLKDKVIEKIDNAAQTAEENGDDAPILIQYYRAVKNKICPVMEIK